MKYSEAKDWQAVKKHLDKLNRVFQALVGQEDQKEICSEVEKFLKMPYKTMDRDQI